MLTRITLEEIKTNKLTLFSVHFEERERGGLFKKIENRLRTGERTLFSMAFSVHSLHFPCAIEWQK